MESINWKTLTSEQRNQIVAEKVLDWKQQECEGEIGCSPISPDGWFCQRCGQSGYWGDDTTHQEIVKGYSTDIGAAWLIVEKFRRTHNVLIGADPNQYDVAIYGRHGQSIESGATKA